MPNAGDYQPIVHNVLEAVLTRGGQFTKADEERPLSNPDWRLEPDGRVRVLRQVFAILHVDREYGPHFRKIQLISNVKLTTTLADAIAKYTPGEAANYLARVVVKANEQAPYIGV